ncbi:MAG: aldehyde dehydrogenase family protein [Chitinophagales bacterium]
MQIINPATEELIKEIEEDHEDSIQKKFLQLKKGQTAWAAWPLDKRIACFARFIDLLDENSDELAVTLTSEMGKPLKQAHNELKGAVKRVSYFTRHAEKYLQEEWIAKDGVSGEKIVYEPLGIIANISAWNYPFLVSMNVLVPALMAGNAVFYKPSEFASLTGLHIVRLLYQAGIPENALQAVIGRGHVGELLLNLPLDGYYFTGSYKTGKYIAEKVAAKLVPCQLELGGKDPLYIMDDVENIQKTAAAVLEGVVYNNGQSCCAVERVYVHEKIFDAFVEAYVSETRKMKVGDPMDPATDIGPLSRPAQAAFLESQVKDAVTKGALVLCGGHKIDQKGYFFEPTALINVDHGMRIMTEESFGPLVGIQKVGSDQEAIEKMQDTEYGLTAAVYSKSYGRAEQIMRCMNTGTVYWNCCDRVSPALPWSGRKHSGLGTTLSYQGIRAFVQPKAYHLNGAQ